MIGIYSFQQIYIHLNGNNDILCMIYIIIVFVIFFLSMCALQELQYSCCLLLLSLIPIGPFERTEPCLLLSAVFSRK